MKNIFLIIAVFLCFNLSAGEVKKDNDSILGKDLSNEVFGLEFNVGMHAGFFFMPVIPGGSLSLFTLRWEKFHWEIVKARYQYVHFDRIRGWNMTVKSVVGASFLSENQKHEGRVGGGIALAYSKYHDIEGGGDADEVFAPINIALSFSYHYHMAKDFSVCLGYDIEVPILSVDLRRNEVNNIESWYFTFGGSLFLGVRL